MSIVQINKYSNIYNNINAMQKTSDLIILGKLNCTITNWATTSESQIAGGSYAEINGALYEVTANTAISGSPSDGHVYIMLIPSGDPALGTATFTPTYTNTAPTWDNNKKGFYGISTNSNYRYLEYKFYKSGTSWYNKNLPFKYLENNIPIYRKTFSVQMTAGVSNIINHYLYNLYSEDRVIGYYGQIKYTGIYHDQYQSLTTSIYIYLDDTIMDCFQNSLLVGYGVPYANVIVLYK